nr:NERD domain-containing protein [Desulfofarcimen acetoxidans]
MSYLKKGLEGENNVYYELKNSFLPILCLHDIRLEYEGYTAQYDFIVISDRFLCVLETKQLNGNILINSDGTFIRVIHDRKGIEIKREGMYSPITQNQRHINILKKILLENQLMSEEWFYLSFVVIANPKSIIHKEKCPTEINEMIIRHDQVINSLKYYQQKSIYHKLEKYLFKIAYWLKENNKPITYDYYAKYNLTDADFLVIDEAKESKQSNNQSDAREYITKEGKKYIKILGDYQYAEIVRQKYIVYFDSNVSPLKKDRYNENEFIFFINEDPSDFNSETIKQVACTKDRNQEINKNSREQLAQELKEFRLLKSREEKIAAYMIYSNEEMENLISAYPTNKEELLKVKGFGLKKVEKYGEHILKILNKTI